MKKFALVVVACALMGVTGSVAQAQVPGGINGYGNVSHNVYEYGHTGPAYTVHHLGQPIQTAQTNYYGPRTSFVRSNSKAVVSATANCGCPKRQRLFRR